MGGRGSGGGRSGGGGGSASRGTTSQELLTNETINQYATNNRGFIRDIQSKLKSMSDTQLNQQFEITEREMKRSAKKLKQEQNKLKKLNKKFEQTTQGSKEYHQKMKEMNTQINNVEIAKQWAGIRGQAHYIVVNERNNVRGKK